jgi:AbiV family abortive infection protein
MESHQGTTLLSPYSGELTPVDAANAIRAARLNALDLLDTAEILYNLKRFSHSMAFSTLAIEESSKHAIILLILIADEAGRPKAWKAYRNHLAKTQDLNKAIESRIRVTFPRIPPEDAKKTGEMGPTPKQLEYNKQLAIYSDCLSDAGSFACHLPNLSEWRTLAWDRLCEAQALAHSLRDRTPEELSIFVKHIKGKSQDSDPRVTLRELQAELLQKGLIKEGWWDAIIQGADELFGS